MPLAALLQNLILTEAVEAPAPVRPFVAVPPALTANVEVAHASVMFVWQVVDPALVSKTVGWGVDVPVGTSIHMVWETVVSGGMQVDVGWEIGREATIVKTVVWDTGWVKQYDRVVWIGPLAERVVLLVLMGAL